jgi:ABC-type uncharacterized transport system ATPase subunit
MGEAVTNLPPGELIDRGISYVPEDRLGMGLVPGLDAVENMLLKSYKHPEFSGHWLINRQAARRDCGHRPAIQRQTGEVEPTGAFDVGGESAEAAAGA